MKLFKGLFKRKRTTKEVLESISTDLSDMRNENKLIRQDIKEMQGITATILNQLNDMNKTINQNRRNENHGHLQSVK